MSEHRIPIRVGALVPARIPSPKSDADEVAGERPSARERYRRAARERVQVEQDRLLLELLSVADDLERALRAAQGDESLWQGIALIHHELMRRLRKYGVERIPTQGMPFDPRRHEVVDVIVADELDVEPGQVVQELRPGYWRDGRLLRPAWVVVAVVDVPGG